MANIYMKDLIQALVSDELALFHTAKIAAMKRYDIDLASDQLLDNIGELLGQARFGISDVDYRVLLKARAAANNSSGRTDEVLYIFSKLTEDSEIVMDEMGNRTIILRTKATLSSFLEDYIYDFMKAVIAGGINLEGIVLQPTTAFKLGIDTGGTSGSTSALGLGDVTQTFGGVLTKIISI